ncbi:lipopolysaccharide biosynthesis protein [Thomasclavelia sp.]|uniref:lipopolysaccharide biosynthesis protein n=1 Tax=Thomasclavelia sp. TaxID=3025757 RepID=UPI0025ECA06B|nr:lipopolysaccharide biosynthesis protein [Thomasclavelia sp.]
MNKIISNLIWKFSERMLAQIVTFIVSIVLARLLSPSEYGTIALVMVFISIADVFANAGFGNALIQKLNVDNVDYSSVLYFSIFLSFIIYILLFILAPHIADLYNNESLTMILRVLGLRVPIAAFNSIQQAYVSKNMLFKRFFFSTLFGTILSGFVGCIMAYKGFGIWALVAQYLTNTVVDTTVLWFTVKWRPNLVFSFKRVTALFSFGWKLLLSSLIDTGYQQLRSLVIGGKYSSSDLAYYNRGQQYPQLVVTNVNTSISSVLFPAISQNQENLEIVRNMTRKAIKTSSYIMWPLMFGLAVISKPLISWMLTDKWLPCVPYLQIACFTYGFWPIHTANLEALKAIGRSDLFLKLEIIKKIIGIVLLVISMNYGVMAIALSMIVSTLLSSFINAFPNSKILRYSYMDQIRDLLPSLLLSLLMAIIIYPVSYIIDKSLLLIIVQVILGAVIYMFFSILFKLEPYTYIVNTIKNINSKNKC